MPAGSAADSPLARLVAEWGGDPAAEWDELIGWCHRLASEVARRRSLPDEADALANVAVVGLLELAGRFDHSKHTHGTLKDHFLGYAHRDVLTRCHRHVDELEGGGTLRTCRPENRRVVGALGDAVAAIPASDAATDAATDAGPEPVTRLLLNGCVYALPFERLFRPLTGSELADLEASIDRQGIINPVTVCTLPGYGPSIIDGANRARVALARGLPLAVVDHGPLTLEEAEVAACTLNKDRRHLTAEEVACHRAAQAERMRRLRDKGLSLRAIARLEGIRHTEQVRRAVKAAGGDTDVSPRPPPDAAAYAAKAARALDAAFKQIRLLLKHDREQVLLLATQQDIPFTDDRPGREDWPALTALSRLRGLLANVS